MRSFVKSKFSFLLFSALLCIYHGCASRGAPQGGPVDRTPPEVIQTIPAPDSIRLPINLARIVFEFSEAMEEGSLTRNVFISPPVEYELKWKSARKLEFLLKDSLRNDQTYVVSIGSSAQDLHNNRLSESFHLAFSTGDKIDQGRISGRVFDIKRDEVINLFGYIFVDSATSDPRCDKPLYVSQCAPDGRYQLNYLKDGQYRVFAVQDLNNNLLLDADEERVGIPFRDVSLSDSSIFAEGLDFRLTRSDTTAPKFLGVRPVNNAYLQLRLSEPALPLYSNALEIVDSLSRDTLSILNIHRNIEFANVLDIFTVEMDTSARYRLFASALTDSSGNKNDSLPPIPFRAVVKTDTTSFRLLTHLPKDSAQAVRPEISIFFEFSNAVAWPSVQSNFRLVSAGGKEAPGEWRIQSAFDAEFQPNHPLSADSCYRSILNLAEVKNLWEKTLADSLCSYYFCVVSERELGQVSGKVIAPKEMEKPVVLNFRNLSKRDRPLSKRLAKAGDFKMDLLPEGKYLIDGFADVDENGRYSAGRLQPFQFAEPFHFSADTLKVRKRWETENVEFRLPESDR